MNLKKQRIVSLVLAVALPAPIGLALWWREHDELDQLIVRGLRENPRLQRFGSDVEAARHARTALDGFWDPRLYARSVHEGGHDGDDRAWMAAGATLPLPVGGTMDASLGGGRVWPSGGTDIPSRNETTASLVWRHPLWRDRGFREWRLRKARADAEYAAAHARWVAEAQALRRDISLSYLTILQRQAQLQVASFARERAETLREEAETLAALEVIPEYQVSAARLEAILRHEETVSTRETIESERWHLHALLGMSTETPPAITAQPDVLIRWAQRAPALETLPDSWRQESLRRGDRRELAALQQGAQSSYELAMERRRSDLSLEMSLSHHADDPDRWPATSSLRRERTTAWETALVWSRAWGRLAERAESARQTARVNGFDARRRALDREHRALIETAFERYRTADERLRLMSEAVRAAEQALEAEAERFRLGESRSRDVLDAQKDLTDTLQRQNRMAAELLQAAVEIHYRAGFASVTPQDGETMP